MWVRSYKELSRIYVALFYRHLAPNGAKHPRIDWSASVLACHRCAAESLALQSSRAGRTLGCDEANPPGVVSCAPDALLR